MRTCRPRDKIFGDLMSAGTGTRRTVQNGMFTFACPSRAAWFPAALDYTLAGVSWQIRCPALVIGTGAGRAFKGQARTLYDAHLPQGIPDVHHRGRAPGTTARRARRCPLPSAPSTGSRKPQPRTRPQHRISRQGQATSAAGARRHVPGQ